MLMKRIAGGLFAGTELGFLAKNGGRIDSECTELVTAETVYNIATHMQLAIYMVDSIISRKLSEVSKRWALQGGMSRVGTIATSRSIVLALMIPIYGC